MIRRKRDSVEISVKTNDLERRESKWVEVEILRHRFLKYNHEKAVYFTFMVTEMKRPRGKCT